MRPRGLLVLAVAVLALGAFLWFIEGDRPGSDELRREARRVLPDLDPAAVTALEIETGEVTLRLERRSGAEAQPEAPSAWRIAAPPGLAGEPAADWRADALLDALAALVRERELDVVDPPSQGLDVPRVRLRLERPGASPLELRVGLDVPASRNLILAVRPAPDAPLRPYVVDRAILFDLEHPPEAWRQEPP